MKKILAILLSVILIISICPMGLFSFTASATQSGDYTYYTYTVGGIEGIEIDRIFGASGDVVIPSMIDGKVVLSIGFRAFRFYGDIISITIPDSVINIGDQAFWGCNNLKYVTIGNGVTDIGEDAFNGCSSLTSVNMGDNVTNIGEYAFANCSNISSIIIPDNVTRLESRVFANCSNITQLTIGKNVKYIAYDTFNGCSNLTTLNYNAINCEEAGTYVYPVFSNKTLKTVNIGKEVTRFPSYLFYNSKVETVNITDIKSWCEISVGVNASPMTFGADLYLNGVKLSDEIIIPEGTEKIADFAFSGCSDISSVTIPESVKVIYDRAFSYCDSLTTVNFNAKNSDAISPYDYSPFLGSENLKTVNIGKNVEDIPGDLFNRCRSLELINISDNVKYIGADAFYDTAYYNDDKNWDNGVLYIGNHLIKAETSLLRNYEIKIGTKTISSCAFYDCDSLTSVIIPNTVISINSNAFGKCNLLKEISISKNTKNISPYTFSNSNLEIVNFLGTCKEWENMQYSNDEQFANANIICTCMGEHTYIDENDVSCNECDFIKFDLGDIDGIDGVTDADAVYLLYHTFLSDIYPVNQDCDFNGDGEVNDKDAVYLLYYTFLPDLYPIN